MKNIGIICTWPWGVVNAESEVICRMKVAAQRIGANLIVITKEGYLVDESFHKTENRVDENTLDFIISMHYEDVKLLDVFHYHTVWNPPNIMLQYEAHPIYAQNMASNDDFLIYDDGGMKNYIQSLLDGKALDLETVSSLTASFSETMLLPPAIPEKPSLFYCGSNWERFLKKEQRHKGLFSLLDKQSYTHLYGPKHAWDGYKTFKGTIPFDGESLIKTIQQCGVVLALTSDYHYRAGAATNRIYEACAGGAVTITDTNRFIKKHWGDSVLYIDYDPAHPERMFKQIDAHMKWIASHPKEALAMAQRAQKICREKFALEKQLTDILNNHPARQQTVAKAFYAQKTDEKVLAVLFLDTTAFDEKATEVLSKALGNIQKQIYKNITLAVCCEKSIESEVKKVTDAYPWVRVFSVPFFDKLGNKELSRAQAFFQINTQIPHEYVLFTEGRADCFSTHITQLKRALEEDARAAAAYSATYMDTPQLQHEVGLLHQPVSKSLIYKQCFPDQLSTSSDGILFRADAEKLPPYTRPYIDNLLPNALLSWAVFKENREIRFVPRVSCGKAMTENAEVFSTVSPLAYQIRFIQRLVRQEALQKVLESPLSEGYSGESALPREVSHYVLQGVKLLLSIQIFLHSCRLLWAGKKDARKRVKARIQNWKQTRKKLKEMLVR